MGEKGGIAKFYGFMILSLIIGFGMGYFLSPRNVIQVTETEIVEIPVEVLVSEDQVIGDIKLEVERLTTLVYGAIGASLIAALAAIVSLIQISQRLMSK